MEVVNVFLGYFPILKGTLIIAAIGSNGIVIAVDSRVSIVGPNNGNVIGYIDGMPKTSMLNQQFPIAVAGKSTVGGKTINQVLEEFNAIEDRKKDVQQSFIDFKAYLTNLEKVFPQKFIGGGYFDSNPWLFFFNNNSQKASSTEFFISEPGVDKYLPNLRKIYTCEELKGILEKAIYDYAKGEGKEYEIGGPISIVKISTGNKVKWLQNNFMKKKVYDYTSIVELVKKGKLKLVPVTGFTKSDVLKAMESNVNYKPKPKISLWQKICAFFCF